jgi:CHAT domain-containing protein
MTDLFASVREHVSAGGDQELLDRLHTTIGQIARLSLNPPSNMRPDDRQDALAALEARKEQFEATLSEHSADFRAQMRTVTVEAVQAALPDDAALLEFAVFRPFDPWAARTADAYGSPHYAAYVLRKHEAPVGVDLGDAATLDRSIDALRESLRTPASRDVLARARAVDARVMSPIRAWLGDASRLIISPDGALNLVPFEAFVDDHGAYLLERYTTSYVTSGRDLLRMQVPRGVPTAPVILADPLFGEPPATVTTIRERYFPPLAATRTEARRIQTLFPDATLLTGARASKAMLQQVSAPRILHIASHGFFFEDVSREPSAGASNPLLRSGLALAGANAARDGRADGILTALEASGLDLWGTRLVTLSACDTGVGEIRNGEGVYGLRRAFFLAGAETLVMSLWAVSDYVARDAMVAYYTGLRAQLGRGDALRQAKLAMLRRSGRRHPYYWASFIQSGEWADLDGRR